MSVLDVTIEEKELSSYINDIDQKLESEAGRFANGDGVYVGTRMLRDFYKGKHWSY